MRAAKQRARNTGPLGLHGVSLSAADTTGDSGIGTGSECGGERPSGGGGRVAVIDLVARGSGDGTSHHSVPPAGLKQSAIEKVSTLANSTFDSMLTWTRARAIKRMMDNPSLTVHAKRHARYKLRWPTMSKPMSALSET